MSIMLGQGLSGLTEEPKSTTSNNRFKAHAAVVLKQELLLVVACESDTWHRRQKQSLESKTMRLCLQ